MLKPVDTDAHQITPFVRIQQEVNTSDSVSQPQQYLIHDSAMGMYSFDELYVSCLWLLLKVGCMSFDAFQPVKDELSSPGICIIHKVF